MTRVATARARKVAGLASLWAGVVAVGMGALIRYAATPGDPGGPPPWWPAGSAIPGPVGRPLLLMMVHPRCPCSRASLEELARLMAREPRRCDVQVVFYVPADAGEEWWRGGLWQSAVDIPGAGAILDREGVESQRFHVETSGHALLYDAGGRLRYSGGITKARGHAGDNAGVGAIAALLEGGQEARRQSPVFGCALHSSDDRRAAAPQ